MRRWAIARAMVVAVSLSALTGCTSPPVFVMTPPLGGYPAVRRIDLAVGLVIDHELRDLRFETPQLPEGGPRYNVGEALSKEAETICRQIFRHVEVDLVPPEGVDLYVFPRVVSMRTTRPAVVRDEVPLTVVLEWKVVTPGERLVWLETVRSTVWEPAGYIFFQLYQQHAIKRLDAAFQDLFLRSQAALAGSPEIRGYAAQAAAPAAAE